MGEMLRLLPPAVSLNKEPAIADPERSTTSPTGSDKTITAPPISSTGEVKPQPGRGSAIFSTDLCRRPPRGLQDPQYVRAIARSDMVKDVVAGAGNWLRKYPYQYYSIVPRGGWQIGDLWDDYDIQIEGEAFSKEMLGFIERDNAVRAQNYAHDWSTKHPERLSFISGNTAELYDKANPLSIVGKLFTNGESREYPLVFLWNVAHFMRTSMLAVKGMRSPVKEAVSAPDRPAIDHKDPMVHGIGQAPAKVEATANVPVATSTTAKASTPAVKPLTSTPNTQTTPTWQQDRQSPRISAGAPPHGRFADPGRGIGYAEPMAHMMPALSAQAGGPNAAHSGLRNPRTRPGHSASGSHNQIMPSNPYTENMPYVPSGFGSRQHAGPMSMVQSPRFNQAHVAMNHPLGNVPPGMVSFAYDQGPIGSGMISGQPHPAGVMHPVTLPLHAMQGPPMTHGYARQPSSSQGPPFAVTMGALTMGDMTNMRYSPAMPMQILDPRRPADRRLSQQHGNGNGLYDPYEGNNPAFRTSGYPGGKKYYQNGPHNSNGRQRKTSFPGNRPYHGQYTNERPSLPQIGASHFPGRKGYTEDDHAITQDQEHGCYVDWIGPHNETVNELFVKNLPEDIQDAELETLFQERLGIKPTSVNVRTANNPQYAQQAQGRRHAFVGFPTAAITKQALVIHSPTVRGLPVSITVPKRFFQKTLDVPPRDMVEAGPSAYSRYTSNPNNREGRNRVSSIHEGSDVTATTNATKEKLSYSAQDARSDLHKKKKGKQAQPGQTAAGSPEARKSKPKKRQESPAKEMLAAPAGTVETDALDASAKTDDYISASVAVQETTPDISTQTEQPQTLEPISCTVAKKDFPKAADALDIALKPDASKRTPNTATDDPQQVMPQRVDPQPQQTGKPDIENTVRESVVKPQMDVAESVVESVSSISLELEEPVSDDELKDDASFHSATKFQSDLEVIDPKAGAGIANHGTTVLAPEANTTTTISPPGTSVLFTKTVQEYNIVPSQDTLVPTAVVSEASMSGSKPAAMLPVRPKEGETAAPTQQKTTTPTITTTLTGTTKKRGTQQTESITPFLSKKALAAQAKKEREQRKKAQKKEKEQAQQTKVTKAATNKPTIKSAMVKDVTTAKANGMVGKANFHDETKHAVDVESAGTSAVPSVSVQDDEGANEFVKEPRSAAIPPNVASDSRDKPGKHEGKKADSPAAKETAPAGAKSEDHGKQTNGTSDSNEIGSVTNKDVRVDPQEMAQEMAQEIPQDGTLAPNAQSSKQDDTKKASSDAPGFDPAMPPDEAPTSSGKKNKKNKKNPTVTASEKGTNKPPLAWPDLEFRPKSPNPPWMGPIDMEMDVQNYDEIMNKACDGPDDSDFSWSDLPTMEEVLGSEESEVQANEVGGSSQHESVGFEVQQKKRRFSQALLPKIRKLQPDLATEIMARILTFSTDEIAEFVSDNSALVAKVDEIALFGQGHDVPHMDVAQPMSTQSSTVAREKSGDRRIAALETQIVATKAETRAAEVNIAVYDKQLDVQETSDTVAPNSQPAKKKKKPNNRKNRKKKAAENGEAAEPSQSGDTAETTSVIESFPGKAGVDIVDSDESFKDQMRMIDAIKQRQTEAVDTAAPTDEPQFIRTMEAYFREAHPHRVSKGRKVSKEDLQ